MVAAMEPTIIQKAMQKAGTLTDETNRNGSLKRNHERIRNGGEPSIDKNVNDDNKRTRTGNTFATTANRDCRVVPRVVKLVNVRNPTAAHGACYKCGALIISRQHPLGTWKGIYVGNREGSPGPKHRD
nr:hypothetical protein [Tanacetum cinerariifolium]